MLLYSRCLVDHAKLFGHFAKRRRTSTSSFFQRARMRVSESRSNRDRRQLAACQSGVGRMTGDDTNGHRVVHSFWRRASYCNFTCDACDAQPPVPVPVPVVPLAIPVQAALLSVVKYTCCPPVGEVATLSMMIPLEPPADASAAKGFALGPVGTVATL